MKALLCCRACSPKKGSEPGMGWHFAHAIASFCETHVIVLSSYQEVLEKYCADHPQTTRHLHFHYLEEHLTHGRIADRIKRAMPKLYYYYHYRHWLQSAAQFARELDEKENFDIVHQVTLAGFRFPGYLWHLKKPLLWGPCGGFDDAPYRLLLSLRMVDIVAYAIRNIINTWQKRFGYAARVYSHHADYILASTREGERVIRRIWKHPGEYMCEIGTHDAIMESIEPFAHRPGSPLRVCWAGEMSNQRKNLPLLFRALEFCESPVEVCVMGDGRMKAQWEALASKVPARHRITFLGAVAHETVFEVMKRSHVFCITSVKDDTSSVLLEALQHGLPIIAPDSCGFAGVVTEECGIKIRIDWPNAFARSYGAALNHLAQDESLRMQLAHGATKRAEAFTWAHKTQRLKEIYTALVAGKQP